MGRLYDIIRRIRLKLALCVPSRPEKNVRILETASESNSLEKRVRQHDVIEIPTCRILEDVLVNEEQQGHVDLFPSQQLLFLKTEAFHFSEVWRNLGPPVSFLFVIHIYGAHSVWRDVVRRDTNHVMIRVVLCLVKCETRLARQHCHVFLLRRERPRKLLAPVRVEVYFYTLRTFNRHQPLCLETTSADNGSARKTRRCAEHAVQRHCSIGCADCENDLLNFSFW